MLLLRAFSLAVAGFLTVSITGCDDGGSGGSGGTGGAGGSGGSGGTGGDLTTTSPTTDTGAGGSATGGAGGTGGGGASPGEMVLTSPDLAEGAPFPVAYTCDGKNISPQLDWTPGPEGTLSYALLFRDESINLVHWTLWNVPATATGLPPNVETTKMPANVPGARQRPSYDGATYGYLGPCPPVEHTYKFTVYALKTATLPFVGPGDPAVADVQEEITANKLAEASLSGTYGP